MSHHFRATAIQWTPEVLEQAAALWRSGATGSAIAAKIGCTRNAMLAKADRHRDIFPQRKIRGAGNSRKARLSQQANPFGKTGPLMDITPSPRRDLSRSRCEGQEPVVFAELTSRQCHFPLSPVDEKGGPFMPCCGAEVSLGESWCEAHRAVVYVKKV